MPSAVSRKLRLRNNCLPIRRTAPRVGPSRRPYDRVIVTAAAPEVPSTLIDGLAPGGVLVAPVGEDHRDQQLCADPPQR